MEEIKIHDLVKSLLFLSLTSVLAHGERPNIIRVICDDLTWQAMGCYGSTLMPTPQDGSVSIPVESGWPLKFVHMAWALGSEGSVARYWSNIDIVEVKQ
jgi:hypothetical protein